MTGRGENRAVGITTTTTARDRQIPGPQGYDLTKGQGSKQAPKPLRRAAEDERPSQSRARGWGVKKEPPSVSLIHKESKRKRCKERKISWERHKLYSLYITHPPKLVYIVSLWQITSVDHCSWPTPTEQCLEDYRKKKKKDLAFSDGHISRQDFLELLMNREGGAFTIVKLHSSASLQWYRPVLERQNEADPNCRFSLASHTCDGSAKLGGNMIPRDLQRTKDETLNQKQGNIF